MFFTVKHSKIIFRVIRKPINFFYSIFLTYRAGGKFYIFGMQQYFSVFIFHGNIFCVAFEGDINFILFFSWRIEIVNFHIFLCFLQVEFLKDFCCIFCIPDGRVKFFLFCNMKEVSRKGKCSYFFLCFKKDCK